MPGDIPLLVVHPCQISLMLFWKTGRERLLPLRLLPGAKNDSFPAGYNVWRKTIGCRVTAPAVEGKANRAIIALVSDVLEVPPATVSIQSGATSSQKRVLVTGMNKKDLLDRLNGISTG